MLLLDEHSPRIPAAKRRLMVWPLQPRSSTEAFCLKSSHVHICSTPVFKRALSSSEHVRWTLTPLRACPALPYPTLAARGQDKRTPTYPTHKPDPLTMYPLPGKEPEPGTLRFGALLSWHPKMRTVRKSAGSAGPTNQLWASGGRPGPRRRGFLTKPRPPARGKPMTEAEGGCMVLYAV